MPGTRRFDSGSASTGQPATSAKRNTVDGLTPAPQPATTSPRGRSATRWASASSISTDGARTPGALRGPRPVVGAAGRVDQLVAGGHQRLAERQVEVHRPGRTGPSAAPTARRGRARATRRPRRDGRSAPRARGTSAPPHRRASPGRRSGRRRCRAARAVGRRCTRSSGRGRGGPRAPRGGSSRPRCPTCTAAIAGRPLARARPRAKNAAERSSRCTCTRIRSSPASASASGAEREPGARHASVTPWRTHSSTSVRAKAVVASRLMGGCLRGWRTVVVRARVHADRCVVGPGRRTAARAERPRGCASPRSRTSSSEHGRSTTRLEPTRRSATATYVGYSQGGRLCLQLALDRPESCDRLVLVSASPGIADPGERAARASRPTSGSPRRSSATASTRSSSAGSRSRCSPRLPAERAGLDERRAQNTVERLT